MRRDTLRVCFLDSQRGLIGPYIQASWIDANLIGIASELLDVFQQLLENDGQINVAAYRYINTICRCVVITVCGCQGDGVPTLREGCKCQSACLRRRRSPDSRNPNRRHPRGSAYALVVGSSKLGGRELEGRKTVDSIS